MHINEMTEMWAEFGGELLTVDLDVGVATVAFDDADELDTFMETIGGNIVTQFLSNISIEKFGNRSILTIASTL